MTENDKQDKQHYSSSSG